MKKTFLYMLAAVLPLVFSCSRMADLREEPAVLPEEVADPWTIIPVEETPLVHGDLSITAYYGQETKSQLSENESHTFSSVVWSPGDSFEMVGVKSDGKQKSRTTYTTAEGGASAVFTGGETISSVNDFYCFYPSTTRFSQGINNGRQIFGVTIPYTQTATPGNLQEGANLSFAHSTTQTTHLHFANVVSIIKFRLSGSLVSQVKSVKFFGTEYMSGALVMGFNQSYEPEFIMNLYYTSRERYQSVVLSGDFTTGTDYYVAVAPGYHDSFFMVFSNADGSQSVKKFSSKELTLNRSQMVDFGTIDLGSAFEPEDAHAELYIQHTTPKYATIAVIPDGYTQAEMGQYLVDAKYGIDALFDTEPYKSYRDYFNVWLLKQPSNESGVRISDGTPEEQNRDCYFQSSWGNNSYSDMAANEYRVFNFVINNCPDIVDGTHTIQEVPVLIIINDERYGGISWSYNTGKTYCMVPKSYGGGGIRWSYNSTEAASVTALPGNTRSVSREEVLAMGGVAGSGAKVYSNVGNWRNTLVHEFGGHSIGRLGDEYWYDKNKDKIDTIDTHFWKVPFSLNVSPTDNKASVPWSAFFDGNGNLIPALDQAPYNERIDVFQGADVSMFYRWRSERISCMIDNRFYFSTWQRYLIVKRIRQIAGITETLTLDAFLANDNPADPRRDGTASATKLPLGVSDRVPPRSVPMLPPPVLVVEE